MSQKKNKKLKATPRVKAQASSVKVSAKKSNGLFGALKGPKITDGSLNESQSVLFKKIFWISAALLFVLMSVMSRNYGISGDEFDMNEYGKESLKFYSSFGSDTSSFAMAVDRDKAFKYYGVFFDAIAAVVNKVSPMGEYNTRHLLNSWTGWISMLLCGLIVGRIAGWRAALIALWALFLTPRFLGHSMNNPKDIPFAMSFVIATWGFVRLMDEMPKPSKATIALIIGGIGISIGTRIGGLMLFGFLGLFMGLHWLGNRKDGVKIGDYIKWGLILGAGGYVLGLLFWPYGILDPINRPLEVLERVSNLPISIRELFEGQHMPSDALPGNYIPKYLMISNPIVILVGFALFITLIWASLRRYDNLKLFILFFGFFFPIGYLLYKGSNVYGGWRHVLFTYPYLLMMSAIGWETLIRLTANKQVMQKVVMGLLIVGFLPVMAWTVKSHPNQYTYFNEFVGGVTGAHGEYETDYYYNGMRESTEWLIDSLNLGPNDTLTVATNLGYHVTHYFRNYPKVRVLYSHYYERNKKPWDYGIFGIKTVDQSEMKRGNYPPKGTVHTTNYDKAIFAVVIKRPSYKDLEAMEAMKRNDIGAAIGATEEYLLADPTNADMISQQCDLYMRLNLFDSALAIAQNGRKYFPTHTGLQFNIGVIQTQLNDHVAAISTFKTLLKDRENLYAGHYYLAYNYLLTGQYALGVESANTSLGYNPNFKGAYAVAAECYRKMYQPERAKQYEDAAAQLK
jgi:hypothetical protein